MKSNLVKTIAIIFITVLSVGNVFGQKKQAHEDPKYGIDSASRMECVKNMSLYYEFYKQKNYVDAVVSWRKVYNNCPKASLNTYKRGVKIYKSLYKTAKDPAIKSALIDTLMIIYDQRIVNYGKEGIVLGYKGVDLYTYRKKEAALEVSEMLKKACELGKGKTKSAVISMYMQSTVDAFKKEELENAEVIDAFSLSMVTLDAAVVYNNKLIEKGGKYVESAKKELVNIETAKSNVDALFAESGAANCDALADIFAPKYEEKAEDIEWLKKVTNLLNKYDCTDKEIFAKAAEQQNKLEPSAEAAHNLARLFLKKEDYDKAAAYYEEATNLQEDAVTKALYYYEWSTLAMAQENYPKVRTLSRKAIELNPSDGRPYLMIGRAYASVKGLGAEPVEHRAVYWIAVDKFYQAKQADSSIAEQANEYISTYNKHYPNLEEFFMATNKTEGDSYTVAGWVNETTKVRK